MIDWDRGGWAGSLRRLVAREVKDHCSTSPAVSGARYSSGLRFLRVLLSGHSFVWFVTVYVCADLIAVGLEVIIAEYASGFQLGWANSTPELKSLLKDTAGYYIVAQAGVLAIVSLAVGLISLIERRSGVEVQVYYHESLTFEVFASSTALLAVLCVQVLWPVQFAVHQFGLGTTSLIFKIALTAGHACWLLLNLAALAHFVSESLQFVQPNLRSKIRERYTANIVVPQDLTHNLLRALYGGAAESLVREASAQDGPMIVFGYEFGHETDVEIETTFSKPTLLHDVRMKPVGWVLRRWWRRCQHSEVVDNAAGRADRFRNQRPRIVFTASFDQPADGRTAWCKRHGGVPLTNWERRITRWSFRFRKVPR